MDDVVIARALHVLAVVIWIGGVSMVTTVALPAIRRGDLGGDWLQALERDRTSFRLAGANSRRHRRPDRLLHVGAARSVGPVPVGTVLVDARDGLRVAVVHRCPVRGRAVRRGSPLPQMGDISTTGRVQVAASHALGPARAQPDHHLRCGRGQSGMVGILTHRLRAVSPFRK